MPLMKAAAYGYLSTKCHVVRSELINAELLKSLSLSRSIGEFVSGLSHTPYASFMTELSREGVHLGLSAVFNYQHLRLTHTLKKRHKIIFDLFFTTKYTLVDQKIAQRFVENKEMIFHQIDSEYMDRLKKSIFLFSASGQRQFKKIIGSYFDLINLSNLVKFRLLYRVSIEETLSHMLLFSEKFSLPLLSELCTVNDLQELSVKIKPILGKEFRDYETFRRVLYHYHEKELLSVWSGYPFSLTLPFSLLRLIEIEVSNLRTITEGISFGLDPHEITAMIVGD